MSLQMDATEIAEGAWDGGGKCNNNENTPIQVTPKALNASHLEGGSVLVQCWK